ncbi:MAG: tetratricopeptide repeat protein [Burkholderiales bacterium]|nr:tetratricopeptide repeat protein [Bacteroidia bacterium]
MMIKKYFISLLFLVCSGLLFSQKTQIYLDKDAYYKTGLELFDKKQYTSAQQSFINYMNSVKGSTLLKVDAEYYAAACAVEMFHKDGEWRMKEFIERHPESNKVKWAYFYLGKSNFRKKKYEESIQYLEKVDIYDLSKDNLAELYFKRGYSYFVTKNFEKAKLDLFEIKDVDNKYAHPANYYYSHIAYQEKNYETALQGFNRLLSDESFGTVVPYYITQIYFIQGKFSEVVKNAPALLDDTATVQKEGEINRMIGESYFNLKDFGNALTFFKKSQTTGGGFNAQGSYEIGYCYYMIKDYNNAIIYFEKATDLKDSLAQNAWYHIADCHIQTNNKSKARNAFYAASMFDFDPKIKEDALFSYAKLCYELSFAPYNDAVVAFQKYIKDYPNSSRKMEAYNYLVNVYSTTKSYSQAIASIEKIQPLDPILKLTYQKLIYFKGVEFFNNNGLDSAARYFKKSLAVNFDKMYNALSLYWLGEISYIKKDYVTAIETWKNFQLNEGAFSLKEYDLSNYSIGYAYFQQKNKNDYENANIAFRKFLLAKSSTDAKKIADANIRTADSYFMTNVYPQAADYYETAIALNQIDVDYCIYQKALCSGLLKNNQEKINDLKMLISKYPKSNYLAASIFEMAETYSKDLNDGDNAMVYYQKILDTYPNSSYVNSSLAGKGLVHYNKKEDDKAFYYFDLIVKKDPKGSEAREVLPMIKKIFEAQGKIDEMASYFTSVGNPLNTTEIETSLYEAAKDAYYNQKNCDVAMPKWESYISKYPEGKYISEAHFGYAECAYSKDMYDKAAPSYQYIVNKSRGIYSETSLLKLSYILYKDKKYEEVLPLYLKLEEYAETPANKLSGRIGAMRSAFNLKKFETALEFAVKVLNTEKITPQQTNEARYDKAKSLFELGRFDDALIEFKTIQKSAKNITGAEALYHIAKIQLAKQDYLAVEKTVGSLISYEYSNDDWNTKGLLLLADSYIAKGDDADAELMLQTVIDGKPRQEYVDEATRKMEALKAKKAARAIQEQSNDGMKVEFKETKGDKDLFDQLYEAKQDSLKNNQ